MSPWTLWSIALAPDAGDFRSLVEPLYRYAHETPGRVPLADRYDARTSRGRRAAGPWRRRPDRWGPSPARNVSWVSCPWGRSPARAPIWISCWKSDPGGATVLWPARSPAAGPPPPSGSGSSLARIRLRPPHRISPPPRLGLRQLARDNDIFARTSPEHKLRLVKARQANGEVVAMTGDGVNDAPALKRADVGVAMGIKGTEATKAAAEIVLADDNFTSIERAVEEGRTIYDNLREAILFILPTNGAEALVILIAIVFGLVLPLTPVQILWVNMVTAVTLALALAFEPAEPGVMRRPPRDPAAPILGGAFLWRIGFVSVLIGGATIAVFLIEMRLGMPVELARALAVNTLVCGQAFYLFNSRYLRESSLPLARLFANRVAWLAVGVLAVLQLVFVYAPFMQRLFGSAALELRHWLVPLGIGFAVFLLVEVEKAVIRRMRGGDAKPSTETPNRK